MWRRLQQSLPILLHYRNIKTFEEFESFVKHELCDWYNKRLKKFISPISFFKPIEFEVFKNHFIVSKKSKKR